MLASASGPLGWTVSPDALTVPLASLRPRSFGQGAVCRDTEGTVPAQHTDCEEQVFCLGSRGGLLPMLPHRTPRSTRFCASCSWGHPRTAGGEPTIDTCVEDGGQASHADTGAPRPLVFPQRLLVGP